MVKQRKWTDERIFNALTEIAKTHKEISKQELCELCKKGIVCHPDVILFRYKSIGNKLKEFGILYPKDESQRTRQQLKEIEKVAEEIGGMNVDEIPIEIINQIIEEIKVDNITKETIEEITQTDDKIKEIKVDNTTKETIEEIKQKETNEVPKELLEYKANNNVV